MVLAWLLLLALRMDCSCQALIVLIMLSDLASNTDETHLKFVHTCCFLCSAFNAVGCICQATIYTVSSALLMATGPGLP